MCLSLSQVCRFNAAVAICRYFCNGRCRLFIAYIAFDSKKFTSFLIKKSATKFTSWSGHGRTNRTGSTGPDLPVVEQLMLKDE